MQLIAGSHSGRGVGAVSLAFSFEGWYGDGHNLYQYLGSNPLLRHDPLGLSWDPFDMVDDFLAEQSGERAAFLSQIGQDARAIAIVTANIASWLPFPGVGVASDLALWALGEMDGSQLAMGVAIGIIPGGKLAGKLGGFVSKIGASAWGAAKQYAGMFSGFVAKGPGSSLAGRAAKSGLKEGLSDFNTYNALATALEEVGGGFTRAGSDLVKHGNVIGVVNVQAHFRSNKSAINTAAHDVVTKIVSNMNAPGVKIRQGNGRIFIPLPGAKDGIGALFEPDGTFRSFAGKGL